MIVLHIPLDGELTEIERQQVQQLLRDALGEFIDTRQRGNYSYIVRRYPWMTGTECTNKQQEVYGRCLLAEKLSIGVCDLEIRER